MTTREQRDAKSLKVGDSALLFGEWRTITKVEIRPSGNVAVDTDDGHLSLLESTTRVSVV